MRRPLDRSSPGGAIGAQTELEVVSTDEGSARLCFGSADEFVEIRVDPVEDTVTIDLTRASRDPRAHGGTVVVDEAGRGSPIAFRAFIDGSVLELFASTGRSATCRLYPVDAPPWTLRSEGHVVVSFWDLSAGGVDAGARPRGWRGAGAATTSRALRN